MANVDALLDLGDQDEPLSSPTGKGQGDSSDLFVVEYGENDGDDAEEGEDEDMEEEDEYQDERDREFGEQLTSTSLDEFDPFATTETTETVESVTSGDGVIRTTTVTKTVTRSRSQSHSSNASEGENLNDESQFDDLLGGLATDTMTTTSGTSPKIATTNGDVSSESNAIDDGAEKTTGYSRKTNTKKAKTGNSQPAQQAQKSSKPGKGQRGNSEEQEQLPHTAKAQPKIRPPAPENTHVSSGLNKSHSSAPAPTNHEVVEKFAPPPIAHNVRAMFESGQIPDLHEIKKGPIDINETTESGVYENEPEFLEGVVRSTDVNMSGETVEKGKTKNIVKDWKHKGQSTTKKSAPINIMEGDGCVRESSPIVRDDVVRSGLPDNYEAELPKRGSAKGVLTKWGSRKEAPQKKEIKLVEGDNTEPMVAENEPEIRDDLIHAEESVEFEVGKTRDLAGYWATRTDDVPFNRQVDDAGIDVRVANTRSQFLDNASQAEGVSKQPFVMELADGGPSVVENEPCMLDDNVVRSSTYVEEVVPGERGRIRNMADRIANTPDAPRQRRQIVIDRSDGPCVVENEPSQLDDNVIRADMQSDIVSVDSGHTRSLMNRWKNFEVEASTPKTSTSNGGKPSWVREMEAATESGVYENQPEERSDVVREADNDSEAGMELHTREVKKMWTSKESQRDGPRSKTPEPVPDPPAATHQRYIMATVLAVVVAAAAIAYIFFT